MSEPGRFLIYCIEMYRRVKRISGRVAYDTSDRQESMIMSVRAMERYTLWGISIYSQI